MLKSLIEVLKKCIYNQSMHSSLDEYISSRKPQNAGDVDRFEREYFEKLRRKNALFFHE